MFGRQLPRNVLVASGLLLPQGVDEFDTLAPRMAEFTSFVVKEKRSTLTCHRSNIDDRVEAAAIVILLRACGN